MAGKKIKTNPIFRAQEKGSAMVLFLGLLIILVGAAAFMNRHNKVNNYQLQQTIKKMEADAIITSVHSGIRRAFLETPAPSCLPSEMSSAAIKAFRKFPASPAPIRYSMESPATLPSMPCLVSEENREKIKDLKISIQELTSDPTVLSRRIEVSVELTTKKSGPAFERKANMAKTYQLRPLSLGHFGLMFHSNLSSGQFVSLEGKDTKLVVAANVLFAGNLAPQWSQISMDGPGRLHYDRSVMARFDEVITGGAVDLSTFRSSYRNGLQTGVFKQSSISSALPKVGQREWNHRFDYFPQYREFSYPIPEDIRGPSSAYCGTSSERFQSHRAEILTIPEPSFGPLKASETCASSANNSMLFIFMQASKNLKVTLRPGDDNFCGIVVADTLTVELDSDTAHTYGLIGNFFVRKLVIKNKRELPTGFSQVKIFNPLDGGPFEGIASLPDGQTAPALAAAINSLSSSTLWNFRFPISQSGPFRPRGPDQYLRSCAANGAYTYQESYVPIHETPGFANYLNDLVGTYVTMETI